MASEEVGAEAGAEAGEPKVAVSVDGSCMCPYPGSSAPTTCVLHIYDVYLIG